MNANREDNIWVFDVRAEKTVQLPDRIRLRAFFDAFNLTNSHASETISRATGRYQKPSRDPRAVHGARRLPLHLLQLSPVVHEGPPGLPAFSRWDVLPPFASLLPIRSTISCNFAPSSLCLLPLS